MKLEGVERSETISTAKPLSQITRWLIWGLSGIAAGLLIAKLVFSLNIMWQIFNFAFQVDESEGMIVAETLLMDRGTDIYAPLNADRFIAAPYTPFYYLLNWPFLHFMGASFKPGRFISFLAFCGIAFLIYKIVKRFSVQRPASSVQSRKFKIQNSKFKIPFSPQSFIALLAALFWGSLGLAAFWGGAVKPDILALFFSLSGIYAIFRYVTIINEPDFDPSQRPAPVSEGQGDPAPTKKIFKWPRFFSVPTFSSLIPHPSSLILYSGAVLFALAAFTKQTAFAGVLACLFFLFLQRPLVALRFGAVWAVLAFGPMLLMNWLSKGGFWYHIVTVHELPWSLENYSKFFGAFVQSYQLYIALSVLFLLMWLASILKAGLLSPFKLWRALRSHPSTLFVLYLGTAWGMGLSSGTYGGNHNHLLELAAVICLCSGLMLVQIRQWWQAHSALKWLYPVVLVFVCLQTLGLFVGEARVKPPDFLVLGSIGPAQSGLDILRNGLFDKKWPGFYNEQWLGLEYRAPLARQKEGLSQVAAFMTNDVGPYIYTDNVSLAIASGKPIVTTDPFTQTHATDLKRWDESRLIEMIEHKQFHLIVLRSPIESRLSQTGEARDIYLSPGLARAILANYKLTQPNVAFIYEPKP